MNTAAPASAREALGMLESAMSYLAAADPTAIAAEGQAECLQALERLDAVETAARAWILGAFTAGQGYSADADYSPRAWLIHKTRVTRGAAAGHLGWARRAAAHPEVAAALAEGNVLSESMARTVCGWTDKLPQDCRPAADAILVAAARAGANQRALAELAAEIYTRSLPGPDDNGRRTDLRTGPSGWRPRLRVPKDTLSSKDQGPRTGTLPGASADAQGNADRRGGELPDRGRCGVPKRDRGG